MDVDANEDGVDTEVKVFKVDVADVVDVGNEEVES